jgi:uncharacterized protein (TIGR02246 family)
MSALVFAAVVSWIAVGPASAPVKPDDRARLEETIKTVNAAWKEQMRTGNAAGMASAYEDDGAFVGVDGSCTLGRAEIEKRMRARFEESGLAVDTYVHSRSLVIENELGFEWGDASMTFAGKNGSPFTNRGGFFTIWRRQPDGSWKIYRNVVLPEARK